MDLPLARSQLPQSLETHTPRDLLLNMLCAQTRDDSD